MLSSGQVDRCGASVGGEPERLRHFGDWSDSLANPTLAGTRWVERRERRAAQGGRGSPARHQPLGGERLRFGRVRGRRALDVAAAAASPTAAAAASPAAGERLIA